jgi:UDP-2-acetamido-3-amino-2,3-dideoxy-glucuronate N-acetyltransferase
MVGVPARQIGWMSRFGERLALPVSSPQPLDITCPNTGDRYRLVDNQLSLI